MTPGRLEDPLDGNTAYRPPAGRRPLCLREKGPHRERRPTVAHGERSQRAAARGLAERMHRPNTARAVRAFLAGTFLMVASSGCSTETDNGETSGTSRLTGQHVFTCEGGPKVSVDFIGDGLTINLTTLPDGDAERLTAPAAGVTYFGENVNLAISDDAIVILRAEALPQICRRDSSERVGQPPP